MTIDEPVQEALAQARALIDEKDFRGAIEVILSQVPDITSAQLPFDVYWVLAEAYILASFQTARLAQHQIESGNAHKGLELVAEAQGLVQEGEKYVRAGLALRDPQVEIQSAGHAHNLLLNANRAGWYIERVKAGVKAGQ